jgi:hypothetical protein
MAGGAFDEASHYVKDTYNIESWVFDPFMRSQDHNEKVLQKAREIPFDCCTSISVLNVIDTSDARLKHIKICYDLDFVQSQA